MTTSTPPDDRLDGPDHLVAALAQAMRDANTAQAWGVSPGLVPFGRFAAVAVEFMKAEWAMARTGVLAEVRAERGRQDVKWGEQNHPDGTHPERVWAWTGPAAYVAEQVRANCQSLAADGHVTWLDILLEEVAEAFAEDDPALLRAELVQVAAVAVQWIQAIDRRTGGESSLDVPDPRAGFDGSTVDATDNGPRGGALYDGARAPEASDIDGSHDEVRPASRPLGAVSPGDPDWVDGFGPVPGSGASLTIEEEPPLSLADEEAATLRALRAGLAVGPPRSSYTICAGCGEPTYPEDDAALHAGCGERERDQ